MARQSALTVMDRFAKVSTYYVNDCTVEDVLKRWAVQFDGRFAAVFEDAADVPAALVEAMRYTALAGGKRLRPYLVTRCCVLCGGSDEDAAPAAAAVECVHTFSLVHDDLPAMDDDDFRRGLPAAHKQFGEATAILAGDALLTLAFELIAEHTPDPARSAVMVLELARGTGWRGMIGGQAVDILGEGQGPSRETAHSIHDRKTAALFETSCKLGGLAAGAGQSVVETLGRYGRRLGHAFQIADDLLDVTATAEQMGKRVGKDSGAGKHTYPAAVGIDASRKAAQESADAAVASLADFGPEADDLRALAGFVIQRQH
ncbi:MAG: farnesyl diphosphate synthase [Phycisphaerae bacterium]